MTVKTLTNQIKLINRRMKMKRSTIIYAMAALALTACSNDENLDNLNGPVEIRLTSGLEVQTRATYTQSMSLTEDEKVYAWVDDAQTGTSEYAARELTATASNGFNYTPMYFPQTGNGVNIYAMHGNFNPTFSEGKAFPGAEGVAFTVTADQSGMGTAYTNSDLLYATKQNVARTKDNVELTFYHMLSKMEIAIVSGKGAPELADKNAVTISDVVVDGTFKPTKTADISAQTARQAMIEAGSTKEKMIVSHRTCADFKKNVDYNEAIIVPQDMLGKKIEFHLKNGGILSYPIPALDETPGKAVFESGKKYIYLITLNLTGLEVTAKIEDWESGGTHNGSAEMQ